MLITASQLCESDKFLCKSIQRCINDDWVCDGDNDCGDWSDEANCRKLSPPSFYVVHPCVNKETRGANEVVSSEAITIL